MFIRHKPHLMRERLISRIAESVETVKFTLVSAPPASGKSTLLGQFRQTYGASCVEIVQEADAMPTSGVAILQNIERWDPAQLARLLQDAEHADTAGPRLVMSANRSLDHLLPVARLRRQVIEFGPDELALSRNEVRAFMTPGVHQFIEIRDLDRIYKRVGGWIGAWNIVEAMAENGATLAEISESMSGSLPVFREFFAQYLDQLDDSLRSAVLRLGHFDDISPGLIAAVLGCDMAAGLEFIQTLRAGCPFFHRRRDGVTLSPYPLFQDYISQRARRTQPERHRADLLTAAGSAREGADWLRAAMYFIRADAREAATALLAAHTEELITNRGEVARFRSLTRALQNDDELEGALASELALGAIFAGDFGHARHLIDRVQAAGPDEAARKDALLLCINFGMDAMEDVVTKAPLWLERHHAGNPRFASIVAVGLFWAAMEMLEIGVAERALATARRLSQHANAGLLRDWLNVCEAYLYREQGRIAEADDVLGRASTTGPSSHTMNHLRAALAWERGDAPLCRHLLSSSLYRGARHSVAETAFLGWTCAASLYFWEDEPDRALRLLGEAETTMMARHGERARQMMRTARARLLLQHDRAAEAEHDLHGLAGASPPAAGERFPALEEARRLLQARQFVHSGQQRQAISLLQPLVSRALKQGRMRAWAEASLIYAGALARLGENERAVRTAWPAIMQMVAGGGYRSILSERMLLAPLFDDLMRRSALDGTGSKEAAVLAQLARASGRAPGPLVLSAEPDEPLVVQLTETERKLLALASRGLSNKLIAAHLLIKISTVKWHLHNIFAKLDVRSRTAAIAHARKAGVALD